MLLSRVVLVPWIAALASAVNLPLYFEANQGQAHSSVEFLARGNGAVSYLTAREAVLRVGRSPVRMHLTDAGASNPEGIDRLPGTSSYFTGRDRKQWQSAVPHYAKVRYRRVYPGIDVVYYGNRGELEYDFEVAPGADPHRIRIAYEGARSVTVDSSGDLILSTSTGDLRQKRPVVYQERDGRRIEIAASYKLDRHGIAGVEIGKYDASAKLIVDPVLQYSTYFGTSGRDLGEAVKVDQEGNVYIMGSWATPVSDSNPFVATSTDPNGNKDAVVIKYSPARNSVLSVAHIRANGWIYGLRFGLDAQGAMYLNGTTNAPDFPLVNPVGSRTVFNFVSWVAKISADGATLAYSTLIAAGGEAVHGFAVDAEGNAYVAGHIGDAGGFPWTSSAKGDFSEALVAKLSPAGAILFAKPYQCAFCTPMALALDESGIYVAGGANALTFPQKTPLTPRATGQNSIFATKFSLDGENVIYATLFGGTATNTALAAAVDSQGALYVAGFTESSDFPVVNALQNSRVYKMDGFITQLNAQGNALKFSTYLGGSGDDVINGITTDPAGGVYVTGATSSPDFPQVKPVMTYKPKPSSSFVSQYTYAFAAKIDPNRSLAYSTLLGGVQGDPAQSGGAFDTGRFITVDAAGNAYVVGQTQTADFPNVKAFQSRYNGMNDMFLSVIAPDSPLSVPAVKATPSLLNFSATMGAATPASQAVTVVPGAGVTATASGGGWLSVTPSSDPARFNVSVNPAGLALGTYPGSITFASAGSSSAAIVVTLRVLAPVPVLTSATPSTLQPVSAQDPGPKVTVTGSLFVSGAFATIVGNLGPPAQAYPITVVNSTTAEVVFPGSWVRTGNTFSLTISNPGTGPSNALEFVVGRPIPQVVRVKNAASGVTGPISPGQIVTIEGLMFGGSPATAALDAPVTVLSNVRVYFDGVAASLLYVSGLGDTNLPGAFLSQANVVVPPSLVGKTSTTLEVEYLGAKSGALKLPIATTAIGLFTADATGLGQAAALNEDGTVNTPSTPSFAGSKLTLFATGIGDTKPTVMVDGQVAEVLSMMNATIGVAELTVRIPPSVRAGVAIPVAAQAGDSQSQLGVTASIQSPQ